MIFLFRSLRYRFVRRVHDENSSNASQSPRQDGGLGVGEFLVPAMVAAVIYEFLRGSEIGGRRFPRILHLFFPVSGLRLPVSKEPCSVEMDVAEEKFHRAALRDFPRFVQILLRALGTGTRAGEKAQPGTRSEEHTSELQSQSNL